MVVVVMVNVAAFAQNCGLLAGRLKHGRS
jgi:hypothetical protein